MRVAAYMYVFVYIQFYVCMYVYVYVHVWMCVLACMSAHVLSAFVFVRVKIFMYVLCMNACM